MKNFLLAFVLAAAVLPATAQTAAPLATSKQQPAKKMQAAPQSAEQRAVAYSKELKQKLNLDDNQYAKVLAVNTECIRRKDALKLTKPQDPKASKAIADYRMQEYQSILKPDQLTKLKAMNAQGGKNVKGKMAPVAY
ncbi:hypothetical protein [Pedobacter gandavensis]|uniref:Uncharacterized protein n=1 Tax=Pedobacter gandavensis TaxID=2679963 RepID=A0ABR6ES45_9SPHI|nr:hypothetical protein [Pedobacter gandavensis]MBB2148061.1 hypothetical protein [Pedobacter gandavensis]